ncbi:hypothetical protein GYH30_012210 [Glycine max]|nr:hypothetical protein GYH30_012210 [Glycine max]
MFQNLHRITAKKICHFPNPIELLIDNVDADEVILVVEAEDLEVELGGHGEIDFFGVDGNHEVVKLLGEAKGVDGVLEELGGAMEVGELGDFGGDRAVRVGELRAEAANRRLERGKCRSKG